MATTRLSTQDTSFIYGEDQRIPLHVGGLAYVDAAPLRDEDGHLDIGRIRSAIEERLCLLPLFRKKLAEIPFEQGRPVWVDDPNFCIERHVREAAIPRPGSRVQVHDLMGQLQSQMLDRNRPLWEITFVDGLESPDEVAMIVKIHHSVTDGAAGVAVAKLLFDSTPRPTRAAAPSWEPEPAPDRLDLLRTSAEHRFSDWSGAANALWQGLRQPSLPVGLLRDYLRLQGALFTQCDDLPFNGAVGSSRVFEAVTLPLPAAMEAKRAFQVTLNELMLATVSGALRAYCDERTIDPDTLSCIRAICPVDIREAGDTSLGCNVASLFIELPVAEPDPRQRIRLASAESRYRKSQGALGAAQVWNAFTSSLPNPLLRVSSWFQYRGLLGQGNLMLSNIPGPRAPLYCVGGTVRSFFPYFGVQDPVGLTMVLFSYCDQFHIGLSADPDLMPDLSSFAEVLQKEFALLSALA